MSGRSLLSLLFLLFLTPYSLFVSSLSSSLLNGGGNTSFSLLNDSLSLSARSLSPSFQDSPSSSSSSSLLIIPKSIFMFWYQGFSSAPSLVIECLKSWRYHNPDWNIFLLDGMNVNDWLPDLPNLRRCKSILAPHYSDIIRVNLLRRYGGVWADSTTYCNKPLNDWLPDYIHNGFFIFSNPKPERLIASWFIYSSGDNYMIREWANRTNRYWDDCRPGKEGQKIPYFWFHSLFEDLYRDDERFKRIWNGTVHLEANGVGPHYLEEQPQGLLSELTTEIKENIDSKVIPLYKLKCHVGVSFDSSEILHYLFKQTANTHIPLRT